MSADSQAVYRGMRIGTASPSVEELSELPHHLVGIADPACEQFGAGRFVSMADEACADIFSRGKFPLVVGGTGFYVRNFLLGIPPTPVSDPVLRKRLNARAAEEGSRALHEELSAVDRKSAEKINPNDAYRICRALEVFYSSGKPLSSYRQDTRLREGYSFCTVILSRGRDELYRRIDERVELMFRLGLQEEVEALRRDGCVMGSPGMRAIGYREFFDPSLKSQEEIKAAVKLHSRQYAKKQYTFMRGIPGAVTVSADDISGAERVISDFCSRSGHLLTPGC